MQDESKEWKSFLYEEWSENEKKEILDMFEKKVNTVTRECNESSAYTSNRFILQDGRCLNLVSAWDLVLEISEATKKEKHAVYHLINNKIGDKYKKVRVETHCEEPTTFTIGLKEEKDISKKQIDSISKLVCNRTFEKPRVIIYLQNDEKEQLRTGEILADESYFEIEPKEMEKLHLKENEPYPNLNCEKNTNKLILNSLEIKKYRVLSRDYIDDAKRLSGQEDLLEPEEIRDIVERNLIPKKILLNKKPSVSGKVTNETFLDFNLD